MKQNEYFGWPGWETVDPPIGEGGFGTVYEIRREVCGDVERKALKVIRIPKDKSEIDLMRVEGLDDDSISNSFYNQVSDIMREYKIMSRMEDNPNIVHCDDFQYSRHSDGIGWDVSIRMELLTPLIKALGKVKTEDQLIRMAIELCNGLAACHEANIIHRDIKPQNIFVSPKGRFKLGDFGISRVIEHATRATAGVGTYNFMAPEVASGDTYGFTADIYSLGMVLYWLLNEYRGPFLPSAPTPLTSKDYENARYRRFKGDNLPYPKNGSPALHTVVLKACAFKPEKRYQSARELMEALQQILTSRIAADQDATLSENQERAVIQKKAKKNKAGVDTGIGKENNQGSGKEDGSHQKGKQRILYFAMATVFAIVLCFLMKNYFQHMDSRTDAFSGQKTGDQNVCNHAFTIEDTGNGAMYVCERCGLQNPIKTDSETPESICPHEYDLQMMENGLPMFICRKCGAFNTESAIPLTFLQKESDTNSGSGSKDVLFGDFLSYYGSEMHEAIKFWVIDSKGYSNTESVDYYLGKACTYLSAHILAGEKCDPKANMTIRMYGDGKLIFEQRDITVDSNLEPMVAVAGVNILRIECSTDSNVFGHCIVEGAISYEDIGIGSTPEKPWIENVLMSDEVPEEIVYNGYDAFVMGSAIPRKQIQSITFLDTLKDAPTDSWDVSENGDGSVRAWVKNGSDLFFGTNGGINAKHCKGLFYGYYNVSEINFNHCFHTDFATNMASMFDYCPALSVLDVSDFNTANVTDMSGMFYDCSSLTSIDLSGFNTSKVTGMSCMFTNCSKIKSLDLSSFDTSNVTSMNWMFNKCLSLSNLVIDGFRTTNVTDMGNMFFECPKLETINGLEGFDTRNVVNHDDFMEPEKLVNGHRWEELFERTDNGNIETIPFSTGDIVTFGKYEQNNNRQNGTEPIEWLVLEIQNGKALLLSKYALDAKPYHDRYGSITWEDCSLREWLNGDFLNTAFSEAEKNSVLTAEIDNSKSQGYHEWRTDGGNNTVDKVFLLSDAEAWFYFSSNASRRCTPTAYASAMGADFKTENGEQYATGWWLRSPGENEYSAEYVNFRGDHISNVVGNGYVSIRPAVWVSSTAELKAQ